MWAHAWQAPWLGFGELEAGFAAVLLGQGLMALQRLKWSHRQGERSSGKLKLGYRQGQTGLQHPRSVLVSVQCDNIFTKLIVFFVFFCISDSKLEVCCETLYVQRLFSYPCLYYACFMVWLITVISFQACSLPS